MSFVIYDVETTGLSKRYDQIVQFGAIRLDARLNILERFQVRSRLQPHVIPSPGALAVTGTTIAELLNPELPSHFEMMRQIDRTLRSWGPSLYLGYNSLSFDEEFFRHSLYQSLLDPYLTNTEGNTRGDILRLARAAVHFRPDVLSTPLDAQGLPSMRLLDVAASLGFRVGRGHEAIADVEATAFVCQSIARRAPEVWSRFLQFTQKIAAVDFMRNEEAFVLFHPTGEGRGCYVVSAFSRSPTDGNVHYCLDLSSDLEALRRLPWEELSQVLSEQKLLWRVKANAGPVLFPIYEGLERVFNPLTEEEATRKAASLQADPEFLELLTAAAVANERTYPASPNVEDQLYGGGFFERGDKSLMSQFQAAEWADRPSYLEQMRDMRLRRLGQRITYFERPDLLTPSAAATVETGIRGRRLADEDAPWRTVAKARRELDEIKDRTAPGLVGFGHYLDGLDVKH